MAFTYEDILAGPIVRRVEPGLAAVWIALRKPAQVTFKIWEGLVRGDTNQTPLVTGQVIDTRPVGADLHFALVIATMTDSGNDLQSDRLYSYDLQLKSPGEDNTQGFMSLGLLAERKTDDVVTHLPLGYDPGLLPGFALPPSDIKNLNMLQGSCRKPHSTGDDAMAYIDALFESGEKKNFRDPLKRPHQLFLTGDQIYADEVASDYLALLNTVGNRLLSGEDDEIIEQLPFEHSGKAYGIPASVEHFPPSRRQRLTRQAAKFTSGFASSHLLSFGEYCAAYLLNWSNVLWPADFFEQALAARWQRVQAYKTDRAALRKALEDAKLEDKAKDIAKQKLDSYAAWKLLPPAWRKIDRDLSDRARGLDWGAEDLEGFAIQAPPNTTEDDQGSVDFPKSVPTAVKSALAETLSPSWFVGWYNLGFAPDIDEDELHSDQVLEELRSLQNFYAGLPKVRRVLANVPTYMTFDDHETTDDWNITQNWITHVNGAILGRSVVRSALVAYGLFQAWGNDPLYFESLNPDGSPATDETPGTQMLKAASRLFLNQAGVPRLGPHGGVNDNRQDTGTAAQLNGLFNLNATPTAPQDRVRWFYRIGGVGYEVFSLDTRTFRGFKTPNGPPELIRLPALKAQLPKTPEYSYQLPPERSGMTFVIAAAPVFGFPPIERIVQPIVNTLEGNGLPPVGVFARPERDYDTGVFTHDPEPWSYHEDIFEGLLAQLADHGQVVFISGDVHYAYSIKLDYWRMATENTSEAPQHTGFIQLTASALKNFEGERINMLTHTGSFARLAQSLALPEERLIWQRDGRDRPLVAPEDQPFSFLARHKLEQNEIFLSPAALPPGTQQIYSPSAAWRLALEDDDRSDTERYQGLVDVPAFVPPDPNNAEDLSFLVNVAQKHAWHALHGASRLVTVTTNFGQIKVTSDGVSYAVYYRLRDLLENGKPSKPRAYNVYTIPFAPRDPALPALPVAASAQLVAR